MSHVIHACSERFFSTLSSPFNSTFSSFLTLSISCSSFYTFSTALRTVVVAYFVKKEMDSTDKFYLLTGNEPKNYDLKETYVEFPWPSHSFSSSGNSRIWITMTSRSRRYFITHTGFHVFHSQREDLLSFGQSSSSVSERTERPVVERTGRPVVERGQEQNTEHAQIRTLLDRQKEQSSPSVRRRLRTRIPNERGDPELIAGNEHKIFFAPNKKEQILVECQTEIKKTRIPD